MAGLVQGKAFADRVRITSRHQAGAPLEAAVMGQALELKLNLAFAIVGGALGRVAEWRAYGLGPPRTGPGFALGYILPPWATTAEVLAATGAIAGALPLSAANTSTIE
jgi:hypothetical protein